VHTQKRHTHKDTFAKTTTADVHHPVFVYGTAATHPSHQHKHNLPLLPPAHMSTGGTVLGHSPCRGRSLAGLHRDVRVDLPPDWATT
jgi:hypothetical protein